MFKKKSEKYFSEINPEIKGEKLIMDKYYDEVEKELNSKIQIITLKSLNAYYKSLDLVLTEYIKEHPITQHPNNS